MCYLQGDKPSQWCGGVVVVPKKWYSKICMVLKPLNENILRETYPLPRVDETLAQLTGATLFSKFNNPNIGFWQIPLARLLRPLTTFMPRFGHNHFIKLPLGISSVSELFKEEWPKSWKGYKVFYVKWMTSWCLVPMRRSMRLN